MQIAFVSNLTNHWKRKWNCRKLCWRCVFSFLYAGVCLDLFSWSLSLFRFVSLCNALIFWGNLRESLLFGATTWEMRISEYSFMSQSQKPRQAKKRRKKLRTVCATLPSSNFSLLFLAFAASFIVFFRGFHTISFLFHSPRVSHLFVKCFVWSKIQGHNFLNFGFRQS